LAALFLSFSEFLSAHIFLLHVSEDLLKNPRPKRVMDSSIAVNALRSTSGHVLFDAPFAVSEKTLD
jgi:hypothetical protein